jgi:hypothetical protein
VYHTCFGRFLKLLQVLAGQGDRTRNRAGKAPGKNFFSKNTIFRFSETSFFPERPQTDRMMIAKSQRKQGRKTEAGGRRTEAGATGGFRVRPSPGAAASAPDAPERRQNVFRIASCCARGWAHSGALRRPVRGRKLTSYLNARHVPPSRTALAVAPNFEPGGRQTFFGKAGIGKAES